MEEGKVFWSTNNLFIVYHRVSTSKQKDEGFGLEVQDDVVRKFLDAIPGHKVLNTFVEVEGGNGKYRPDMMEAIELCKIHQATLIVSRFDRYTREIYFNEVILRTGISLCMCDQPYATQRDLRMRAFMAQADYDRIKKNTGSGIFKSIEKRKEKIEAMEAQIAVLDPLKHHLEICALKDEIMATKWGNEQNMSQEGRLKGAASNKHKARISANNRMAATLAYQMRKNKSSLRDIASTLNKSGYQTRNNGKFHASSVNNLLNLYADHLDMIGIQ